jgi:hypothetical protein
LAAVTQTGGFVVLLASREKAFSQDPALLLRLFLPIFFREVNGYRRERGHS